MRILVENGGYEHRNLGDAALLRVAVERLEKQWPGAEIEVVTNAPDALPVHCPRARPVSPEFFTGREIWLSYRVLPRLDRMQAKMRDRFPRIAQAWMEGRMARRRKDPTQLQAFFQSIARADLVVADGGGYLTDVFAEYAMGVVSVLALAVRLGKPTVMVGQGIGPIQSRTFFQEAGAVLRKLALIGTRERLTSLPILRAMGVSPARVITTGDDAIELAHSFRAPAPGDGIGVGLRVAQYSGLDRQVLALIGSVLSETARLYGAPLLPLPVSHEDVESDLSRIRDVIGDRGALVSDGGGLDRLEGVLRQVARCRIVVTGSYHSGLFALAQGIPVVAFVRSSYYAAKFQGLADQFGGGCAVVDLADGGVRESLMGAIDDAWRRSKKVRPMLLESARRQIELGHEAYRRVGEVVGSRKIVA